jgi:hypothetical protein
MTNNCECRFCGEQTLPRFSKKILQKYVVQYYECKKCESLQTEEPYWLDEAYGKSNLSILDTGAAQRIMRNLSASFVISKLFNVKNAIDVGGGDGILCRMLRDYEINCYVKDKYAIASYSQGYVEPDFKCPDLVMGFELLEHLKNPNCDLDELFQYQAKILLFTTEIYKKSTSSWWYLVPESGQHVFFYSIKAVEMIAKKYNYTLVVSGGYLLFVRGSSAIKLAFSRLLLKGKVLLILRIIIALYPARGSWKDHAHQIDKLQEN